MALQPMVVECDALTKHFGQHVAVNQVSFAVPAGSVFALLGPNGAGKTTLVGLLTTLIRPTAGTARVAGADVVGQPARVRESVGVVLQESALDRYLSLEENLRYLAAAYHIPPTQRRDRVADVVALLQLERVRAVPVGQLSGGTIRRAEIAAGILHRPQVLLLDEPTVGLDIETRQAIWRHIRDVTARGTAVILTTHYLEEADRLADRIAILNHGRLVAEGTPQELKATLTRRRIAVYPEAKTVDAGRLDAALATWRHLGTVRVERDPVLAVFIDVADGMAERALLRDLGSRPDFALARLELGPGSLDHVFLTAISRDQPSE